MWVGLPPGELEQLVKFLDDLRVAALAETLGHTAGEVALQQQRVKLVEGPLDRVGLLEDVHAVLVRLDHFADALEVALDRGQPLERVVLLCLHGSPRITLPPWWGYYALTVPLVGGLSSLSKVGYLVEVRGADDVHLFVGVRKLRGGRHVVFEGSYGFGYYMVTRGWLKVSLRRLGEEHPEPWRPVHPYDTREPLRAGEVVPVEIELRLSSTLFRRGEVLRLDVQGHQFFRTNPLFGQFPAGYKRSPGGTGVLHCSGEWDPHLLVPVILAGAGPSA